MMTTMMITENRDEWMRMVVVSVCSSPKRFARNVPVVGAVTLQDVCNAQNKLLSTTQKPAFSFLSFEC